METGNDNKVLRSKCEINRKNTNIATPCYILKYGWHVFTSVESLYTKCPFNSWQYLQCNHQKTPNRESRTVVCESLLALFCFTCVQGCSAVHIPQRRPQCKYSSRGAGMSGQELNWLWNKIVKQSWRLLLRGFLQLFLGPAAENLLKTSFGLIQVLSWFSVDSLSLLQMLLNLKTDSICTCTTVSVFKLIIRLVLKL